MSELYIDSVYFFICEKIRKEIDFSFNNYFFDKENLNYFY
jgi:hypothetical protein